MTIAQVLILNATSTALLSTMNSHQLIFCAQDPLGPNIEWFVLEKTAQ